jgi:hypothetical protein
LRALALRNGDDQLATAYLATKAMYHHWQAAEERGGELATVLVQLSSLLSVPNKRKANKDGLLTLMDNARSMIDEALGDSGITRPMEVKNA